MVAVLWRLKLGWCTCFQHGSFTCLASWCCLLAGKLNSSLCRPFLRAAGLPQSGSSNTSHREIKNDFLRPRSRNHTLLFLEYPLCYTGQFYSFWGRLHKKMNVARQKGLWTSWKIVTTDYKQNPRQFSYSNVVGKS